MAKIKEIKDMTLFIQNKEQQKEKHLFAIDFYVGVNGVLEVDKLLELMKVTGFNLTNTFINADYKFLENDNNYLVKVLY